MFLVLVKGTGLYINLFAGVFRHRPDCYRLLLIRVAENCAGLDGIQSKLHPMANGGEDCLKIVCFVDSGQQRQTIS